MAAFTFNRNYQDLEQVAGFLPDFERVFAEVKRPGRDFAYNDDFKGRISGIAGDCEDTAIYLLQNLRRHRACEARKAELLASGYRVLEQLDAPTRFDHIIGFDQHDSVCEWRQARVIPDDAGRPRGVLNKGKRTRGTLVSDRVLLVR